MPELTYGSLPVPGTPLNELRRWQLDIRCSRCPRHVQISVTDLVARHPSNMRIGELLRRLRCGGFRDDERCNARPLRVKLVEISRYGKWVRRLRKVTALGLVC